MSDWLTPEMAATAGGMVPPAAGTVDGKALAADALAAMAFVQRKRRDIVWTVVDLVTGLVVPNPDLVIEPDMLLGASILALRYFQRRNSPLGLVGSPDLGLTSILRTDPDICALLQIGSSGKFRFGAGVAAT